MRLIRAAAVAVPAAAAAAAVAAAAAAAAAAVLQMRSVPASVSAHMEGLMSPG